ncbi:thioredoxin [Pseudooceanicola sp. CBS1P-1]|uniref:Thioredoxin n=1 Tax=Pseudooceanicola albus TaxID=2692189 RepID=A0A6L7G968_9RHOB|nr:MULTISPECIES: thioredoxin domain-containing protein [Pseudooceanicola]MBT9384468.1 thioredoxin [Pseudooceanicola endophyticus]MXN20631.1 thioredoxin [Pseudooceanicola albus]
MAQDITALDGNTFTDFLNGPERVKVVRFWATWCRPCIALEPIFQEVADELGAQTGFGAVDIDLAPEIAGAFGIRSVPTVVVLRDGMPVDMIVGLNPKSQYTSAIGAAA